MSAYPQPANGTGPQPQPAGAMYPPPPAGGAPAHFEVDSEKAAPGGASAYGVPAGYPNGYPAAQPPAGYYAQPPPGYPGQQPQGECEYPPQPQYYQAQPQPCGCGLQLALFIAGWFFSVCWWVAAILYVCTKRKDPRERCFWIANVIMSIVSIALLITIIILLATGTINSSTCYGYYCY